MRKTCCAIALTILSLTVFSIVISCGSQKLTRADSEVDKIIREKIGQAYDTSYNSMRSHVLAHSNRSGDHSQRTFHYIVIRLSDKKIVNEGSFRNGFVRWISDKDFEVIETLPGRENKRQVISVQAEM